MINCIENAQSLTTETLLDNLRGNIGIQAHSANAFIISYDDSFIFSISNDGCIWIYKTNCQNKNKILNIYSNEMIFSRSRLEQLIKDAESLTLENKVKILFDL